MPKCPARKGQQKDQDLSHQETPSHLGRSLRNLQLPPERVKEQSQMVQRKTLASFGQVRERVGLVRNVSFPNSHDTPAETSGEEFVMIVALPNAVAGAGPCQTETSSNQHTGTQNTRRRVHV
eukprot:4249691-Amphidinium_carterae.2